MIYLNGNPVVFGNFPNKEFNMDIQLLNILPSNGIVWNYEDDGDFIKLFTLKRYLDELGYRSRLYIGYMPYSRMDRANKFYASSLKYACEMINNMGFYKVTVKEAHSDVTPALLSNCVVDNWCERMLLSGQQNNLHKMYPILQEFDSLFFPDAGAQKRYSEIKGWKCAVGYKVRNFEDGAIESFDIKGTVGKNVLIVDDLCSRGGTFVHSAIELKKAGAEKVSLLVTHCEENVFTGELFDHIDMIYTSKGMLTKMIENSKCPIVNEQAKQIKEI